METDLTKGGSGEPQFSANYDSGRHLVTFKRSGFWSVGEALPWLDLATRTRLEAEKDGPYDILTDLSGVGPQSLEVANHVKDHVASLNSSLVRRNAIVTTSAIVRMQFRRHVDDAWEVCFFDTVDAAQNWLEQLN